MTHHVRGKDYPEMQRGTRADRVALSFILEPVEDDPDVLILHLWKHSSPHEEAEAYAEARRRLGFYGISYLGAFDDSYDTFELSACVDYARTSDFACK